MTIGDVTHATQVDEDLWYVDTGMYDVPEYGAVYLLDGEAPVIVDAGIGTDTEDVLGMLDAAGVARDDLAAIYCTHVHLDHAGGAGHLAAECPEAAVVVHEAGADHLADPSRLWAGTKAAVGDAIEFYAEPRPVPEDRIRPVSGGETLAVGDRLVDVHHLPGHAPHQVGFHVPDVDAVFPGDAAGIYVPAVDRLEVTSPPPDFDLERALADVEQLRTLDPSWICYTHFGPARADDRLESYATTLREWVAAVSEQYRTAASDEAVDDPTAATVANFQRECSPPAVWGERKALQEVDLNVRGVVASLGAESDK